jgi:hypothetical protein
MAHANWDTARLRDMRADHYYAASCRGCRHHARLCLVKLQSIWVMTFYSSICAGACDAGDAEQRDASSRFLPQGKNLGNLVRLLQKEEEGRDY